MSMSLKIMRSSVVGSEILISANWVGTDNEEDGMIEAVNSFEKFGAIDIVYALEAPRSLIFTAVKEDEPVCNAASVAES